jgi:N-acetylglucosaminylphosphatidylinositol deacetylase
MSSVWLAMLFLAAAVAFTALWHRFSANPSGPLSRLRGDVLLVFAHPDDEAMFFAPLLEYLRRVNVRVHFLCLSNGNFNGLGSVREKELTRSALHFGVRAESVRTVNEQDLQDGMKEKWAREAVARHVREMLHVTPSIRCVVTFDEAGVSGHPNHVDTFRGVEVVRKELHRADTEGRPLVVFLKLVTHSIPRKYSAAFSLLISAFAEGVLGSDGSKCVVAVRPGRALSSFRGMQCHASQLVWFRYLFVWLSSYTFVNEYIVM